MSTHRDLFNTLTLAYAEAYLPKKRRAYVMKRRDIADLMWSAFRELKKNESMRSGGMSVTKLSYKHARPQELQVDVLLPNRLENAHRSFIISLDPAASNPMIREIEPHRVRRSDSKKKKGSLYGRPFGV